MMHALTAPTAEAGPCRPTLVAPAVRGRRVTGRQLIRRLRADAILDDRLSNAHALPLGARPVLEVVAELIASSPEPGVYRPDPELDGPLCKQIARRLDFYDGEAEVEGHFARLVRAGLLMVGEGNAIVWPVAVPNGARGGGRSSTAGGRLDIDSCPLDTGGRPRRHETKEQARERRLTAQRVHGGTQGQPQRSMTLVIPGGGGAADRTANLAAETSLETSGAEVRFAEEVFASETAAETPVETSSRGFEVFSRAAVAVAAAVGTIEEVSTKETNTAAAESRPAREAVPDEVCAEVSAEVSGPASPGPTERDVGREVALIVAEAARLHGIAATEQARLTARSWLLDCGLTLDSALEMLRREGKRAPGAAPIRVLHWFDCKVAHYLAKQHQAAAVPAAADGGGCAAPALLHPEIAARPEWARQPAEVRHWLKWALNGWELSGSDRHRKLKMVYDLDKAAWALFASVHPEAWEAIGVEPPTASPPTR